MLSHAIKHLFFSLIIISVSAHAGLVNAISVTVNGEPITLYEIHKVSSLQSIPLREALDNLVQERLEISQIKKLGINADAFEVQSRLEAIAAQNNISVSELKSFILGKGMDWESYKLDLEKGIKQGKLYRSIFANAILSIDAKDIRKYYDANPNEFKRATEFKLVRYDSPNEESLKRILISPMSIVDDVTITPQTLQATTLDGRTRYYIDQTPIGEFTPFMQANEGIRMYLVEDKVKYEFLSFETVEEAIEARLEDEKRQAAIDNYFEKLKARADIVVLRRP